MGTLLLGFSISLLTHALPKTPQMKKPPRVALAAVTRRIRQYRVHNRVLYHIFYPNINLLVELGVIGSETHSWRNQNKNATDSTDFMDLLKIPNHVLGQVAPVQTYPLPGLLNLWNPWNPWRFCF